MAAGFGGGAAGKRRPHGTRAGRYTLHRQHIPASCQELLRQSSVKSVAGTEVSENDGRALSNH